MKLLRVERNFASGPKVLALSNSAAILANRILSSVRSTPSLDPSGPHHIPCTRRNSADDQLERSSNR
jgi:hypothetical protein